MVIEKVRKTLKEHDLTGKGQHIILGLSGGPDSVCLFHVLRKLGAETGFTVHAVHINHKLRPLAAERDQEYVERLCAESGTECFVYIKDCAAMAEELSMTSEEAGRKARYDAFFETASAIGERIRNEGTDPEGMVKIAVAHNADDQAETILFRILRGTGTDGLSGMAYRRSERGFDVIRPLLDVTRSEIEAYCADNGLDPVVDHTNSEAVYARNKIRLNLIPYLEREYNAAVKQSLVRLGKIAACDREYIWNEAEKVFRALRSTISGNSSVILERRGLAELPEALRHRVIIRALEETGLREDITWERLTAADTVIRKGSGTKTVEFTKGYRLTVTPGSVRIFREHPEEAGERGPAGRLVTRVVAAEDYRREKGQAAFDLDKLLEGAEGRAFCRDPEELAGAIELRYRSEGDYMMLSGGKKKVKKLMTDMKIPSFERDRIPLAALGREVLWLMWSGKERFAEVYGTDENTERVLTVKVM